MALNVVKPGDVVRVHYTTFAQDRCVIETTHHREPMSFIAGAGEVVEGFDRAVIGMRLGEQKTVPVMPEQAFGYRDARWQQVAPRLGLPDRVAEGDQLSATIDGQAMHVWIRSFQRDEATLDANHPLAGETLIYEMKLVGIGPQGPTDSVFGS